MNKSLLFILLIVLIGVSACMKDDELWQSTPLDMPIVLADTIDSVYIPRGLIIANEGNFTYGNASLSYYNCATKQVVNDVFYQANALPLGDIVQSVTIHNGLGYAVINNSGKIYVFDAETFALRGKIIGLTSPRYIHFVSDTKAYVTDLYSQSISIVNPQTYEIVGAINVRNSGSLFGQHPTEQMVQYKDFVFTNCWSYDNKILVIDSRTDMVVDSIETLLQPTSMVLDADNKLWTVCDGGFEGSYYGYEQPGLQCFDAETGALEKTFRFALEDAPSELAINGAGDTLYYINKHIYRLAVRSYDAPELFIASPYTGSFSGGYYGLAVHPYTSELYVADAIDLVQAGNVYRYSAQATPVDTFKVGIAPGAFCFW